MHYMGQRSDSEFWQHIYHGNTKTEFVEMMLNTATSRMPSKGDVLDYQGAAGWGLWSFVMAGIGRLPPEIAAKELELIQYKKGVSLSAAGKMYIDELNIKFKRDSKSYLKYADFINLVRT
jgi:hypothetical protein